MNVSEVREDQLVMGEMTPDQERAIVAKQIVTWDSDQRFWDPAHTIGRECWDYVVGNVLTEQEKVEAKRQEKMVLQIPELVNKINALEGMQIAGRRDGVILPAGAEDAPDSEAITHLLKDIQRQNGYQAECTAAFTNALVSSYPSCMWFDQASRQDFNRNLIVSCEPWDAVLFAPFFRKMDYSDADRITRVRAVPESKVMELWPDRAEQIRGRMRFRLNSSFEGMITSSERDSLYNKVNSTSDMYDRTGLIYIVQRLHFVNRRVTVWVSPYSDKPEILPPDWKPEEIQRWMGLHPNYKSLEMNMRVLWETTCTSSGVLLENKMHWFQENEFPCEVYVPRVWNGKFHGLIEFLRGSVKGQTVSFMERIHNLRLANANLMIVKNGSLVNAKDAVSESSRVGGVLVRTDTSAPDDITFPKNAQEPKGWSELTYEFMDTINRLSIDRNVEGGTQSSQESAKAIQVRTQNSMLKYSPHLTAHNYFHLRNVRKMLLMVPCVYTEPEVLRYVTKEGQLAQVEFNKPEEYSLITGAVTRVKNNLCGARFDYIEAEGDNSATAKEFELNQFNEILSNLKAVQDMSAWPPLLLEMPNRLAQDFGRRLQASIEKQSQAGPGIEPVKVALTASGEDLLHNPILVETLQALGVVPPPQQQAGEEVGEAPMNSAPFPSRQAA